MDLGRRSRFGGMELASPERRLAEMFALCLEAVPEFANELASSEEWGRLTVDGKPKPVRTELPVPTDTPKGPAYKYIDLALSWEDGTRLWVEIKRDMSGESSDNQIQTYVDCLEKELRGKGAAGSLIYLTKPGILDPDPKMAGRENVRYVKRSWRDLLNLIQSRGSAPRILAELACFLEEEQLAMEEVTLEDIRALTSGASGRVAGLLDGVRIRVRDWAKEHNDALQPGGFSFRVSSWIADWGSDRLNASAQLDPSLSSWANILLEWNIRPRASGQYENQMVFGAGLTWVEEGVDDAEEADIDGDAWGVSSDAADRLCSMDDQRFERYKDDRPRIFRWLLLEQLTELDSLEKQVETLSKFVIDAFEDCLMELKATESE